MATVGTATTPGLNPAIASNPQFAATAAQAQAAGIDVNAVVNSVLAGGTGAVVPGAVAPAAGAQAGAQTATTPAAPQQGITARGVAVQIISEGGKERLATPTGLDERVELIGANGQKTGQILMFNGAGQPVRNFELAARQQVKINLDARVGIASGISNLSRIVSERQERLKSLQEALAQDSNETGNTNQADLQRLVQEQQVSEHLSNLNHKIYESVQNAIGPWLR